jgi:hypothetical protein
MASTYLTRTHGTPTNAKKHTFSVWVKLSVNTTDHDFMFGVYNGSSRNNYFIRSGSDNILAMENVVGGTSAGYFFTNRKFRDSNAWYHIVVAEDTTQATESDRVKVYINGVQETSFSSISYPSQNIDDLINSSGSTVYVGQRGGSYGYLDGSMSHMHFIDGTAYDASAFGETDSTTGEWKIKTSPSVTYGTNGFFILKDGNSVTDQSGNGNNFTVGGGALTKTEDNPSNVFATMNPLATSSYTTLSKGNTESLGGTSDNGNTFSTLAPNSGKYYVESKIAVGNSGYPYIGVKQINTPEFGRLLNSTSGLAGYSNTSEASYKLNGQKYSNNGVSSFGDTLVSGDIVSLAIDCDNGACYASRNGVWQNSGDPTSGANKTGALVTWTPADSDGVAFAVADYMNSKTQTNFGNGYFGTTAVSSAGTNASGNGIFEYDVPTGYTALSTKGLNL